MYIIWMNSTGISARAALVLGAATIVAAAATGMAFAGWLGQGGDMLVSLAASGLAWCF